MQLKFASLTGPAMSALAKAVASYDASAVTMGAAMTVAFASILAADHGQTAKTASTMISETIPQSKAAGHPAGVRRSHNAAFFGDTANLKALRKAVGKADKMTPAEFAAAIKTYVAKVDVRAWYDRRAKANAKAKADEAAAAATKAKPNDGSPDVTPVEASPVLAAQTVAAKAIAALAEIGDADARLALETLQAQLTEALAVVNCEPAKKAA